MKRLYHENKIRNQIVEEDISKYLYNSQEICIQKIFSKHFQINTKKDCHLNRKTDKRF